MSEQLMQDTAAMVWLSLGQPVRPLKHKRDKHLKGPLNTIRVQR